MGSIGVLDLLELAVTQAGSVVASAGQDQAGLPTPCRSWNVRSLVEHIIDDLSQFTSAAAGGRPDWSQQAPAVTGDWARAFRERAPGLLAAWREAGDLTRTVRLPVGEVPAGFIVNQQVAEFAVHAWDLAVATSQDRDLDPDIATGALAWADSALLPGYRGTEQDGMVFGPAVPVPGDAPVTDRLAAFFGRDPAWAPAGGRAKPVTLCVLLWAHPGQSAALTAYEDRVLRLVREHGGRIVQRGRVTGDAADAPDEVQLLTFPSDTALGAYMEDPRRSAMSADRDAAIARTDVHRIDPV